MLVIYLFISFAFEANAQPVPKPSNFRFSATQVPLSIRKFQTITTNPSIPNLLEKQGNKSARGLALEPVAREIYKNTFGSRFKYIDASYNNGANGIDGLLVKKNSRGTVTDVHIIEIKSGKASLKVNNRMPQLSKKWILNSVDKSISEKTSRLVELKNEMNTSNIPKKLLLETKAEYSRINTERRLLKKTRVLVENNVFKRYQVSITYNDGRLKVEQWEVLDEKYKNIRIKKRTPDNVFEWSERKVLADFSYLDKDSSKLSMFEKKVKNLMFENFEKTLRDKGYSDADIQSFMKRLRNDPKFNPSKNGIAESEMETITNKSIHKVSASYNIQKVVLQSAYIAIALISEGKTIYEYLDGKIGKSDLIFNSLSNTALIAANFVKFLNPYMTLIFIGLDVTKNIYNIKKGKISRTDAMINIVANVSGLVVGSMTSVAVVTALNASAIGAGIGSFIATPIGGAIIGASVFAITYGLVSSVVNFTGHKIVNKYESIKSPNRFNLYCNEIKYTYSL